MSPAFAQRVASRASDLQPVRVALTIASAPFYAVGLVVGVVWLAISWAIAAVALGVGDARRGSPPASET